MIIDGKAIAQEIEARVRSALSGMQTIPKLAIIVVGDDPVIGSFVRIKKRMAERLNIPVVERLFDISVAEEELITEIHTLAEDPSVDGIIVQLPLPQHLNTTAILNAVPLAKDVDMLSVDAVAAFARGDATIIPPVAGALQAVLEHEHVTVAGREALVLGHGRLVGVPAAILLRHNGAHVTVIDREVSDLPTHVRESAIIVSGVGKPGLIAPDMLTKGVVILDAGTSEEGGKIVGDADPRCADLASVFTPVPGGIGPIAVAMIFKNLCMLHREHARMSIAS